MTTIVFDGRYLASDSQQSCGSMKFGKVKKIFELSNGGYYSACGDPGFAMAIKTWIESGMDDEFKPEKSKDSFSGLYIDSHGSAYEIDENVNMFTACVPWTGGSGERYAMAAIKLGHSIREAVQISIDLDVYSGGPIVVVDTQAK